MPTCKKCGLENAVFGKNKNYGRSYWCKMCMAETRIKAYESTNWKAVNAKRRSDPEYRNKEKIRAGQRDKERRLQDKQYVSVRSASHRRYMQSSKGLIAKEIRESNRRWKRFIQYAKEFFFTDETLSVFSKKRIEHRTRGLKFGYDLRSGFRNMLRESNQE